MVLLVRLQRLLHRFDDGDETLVNASLIFVNTPTRRSCGNLCGDDHYLEPLQKARRLDDAERFSGRAYGHHGRLRHSGPPFGAAIIGLIAGFAVVFGVEFIDQKLKIDDPCGCHRRAFCQRRAGHCAHGPVRHGRRPVLRRGLRLPGRTDVGRAGCMRLGRRCHHTGVLPAEKTIGLRVSREEEIDGPDIHEHGLISAYADFAPMSLGMVSPEVQETVEGAVPAKAPTKRFLWWKPPPSPPLLASGRASAKWVILLPQSRFDALKEALSSIGVTGLTVTQVLGCGVQKGQSEFYRGVPMDVTLLPKVKVEVVVSRVPVRSVIDVTKRVLYTGHIGDGKIFVYNVENVVKVRTGEEGVAALQDTH